MGAASNGGPMGSYAPCSCAAAPARGRGYGVPVDRPGADPATAPRPRQERPPRHALHAELTCGRRELRQRRATPAVRYSRSRILRGRSGFLGSAVRPAAGVALGLLGAALLLAGCNSTDAGSAPTVTPAPSTVASPSPSSAPALAPPTPTPTAVAQPAPTATPVASASPNASPAISGARPSPVVDPRAPQSLARGDGSDPDTGRREPDGGLPRQSKDEARAGATRGPATRGRTATAPRASFWRPTWSSRTTMTPAPPTRSSPAGTARASSAGSLGTRGRPPSIPCSARRPAT